MEELIKSSDLRISCNLALGKVQSLSIEETIGTHGIAQLTAQIEYNKIGSIYSAWSAQPIKIYAQREGKEQVLFDGVIREIAITKEIESAQIHISAATFSWMMDLEKKSRSYQDTNQTIRSQIEGLVKEYPLSLLYHAAEKKIEKPFLQYEETDWEFILRLSTHLGVPVIASSSYRGISIGFSEQEKKSEIHVFHESWCMDIGHVKFENWRSRSAAYYKVVTNQILPMGEAVWYREEELWVHRAFFSLRNGTLQCEYHLAQKHHRPVSKQYNEKLKGIALSGTVLERKGERIKIHLDFDKEQNQDTAYAYPWLPEYGNLLYCMPEEGSKVWLLIPKEEEQEAIGIQCIRQNGGTCKETQDPTQRWFVTKEKKKMTLQPELLELSAPMDQSHIRIENNSGSRISCKKEILIQAKKELKLIGKNVVLKAPKEVTMVRRETGAPIVVNLCHNLDALGGSCSFENLPEISYKKLSQNSKNQKNKERLGDASKEAQRKKESDKIRFQMKELMEEEEKGKTFELGASISKILAAIPQNRETDPLSQIAVGFRPMFGKMKGE